MGISLTVCLDKYGPHNPTGTYLYDKVRMDQGRRLQQVIKEKFQAFQVPPDHRINWEGIEVVTESSYGGPLEFTMAEEFLKIPINQEWREDGHDYSWTPWNKAVLAMLQALPPDTRVYLWWS